MRSENSGLIDLDALLKEASQPELPRSADDSLEPLPPALEPPMPASVEPPKPPPHPSSSSAVVVARTATVPPRSRASWLGLAAVVAAAAAVVVLGRSREPTTSAAASQVNTAVNPAAGVLESSAPTARGVALGDLPAAAIAVTPSPASAPHAEPRAPSSAWAAAKLVAVGDAPPAGTGDLGGAMREAVGPRSSADVAITDPTMPGSARQLKPSPGAVVGAINAVLPAARACLAEDDAVRSATIVFESNGTVARVELAAPAHPADGCIRDALAKARTSPFVEDTFAARATVRP